MTFGNTLVTFGYLPAGPTYTQPRSFTDRVGGSFVVREFAVALRRAHRSTPDQGCVGPPVQVFVVTPDRRHRKVRRDREWRGSDR